MQNAHLQIAIAVSVTSESDAQFVVDAERLGVSSVWIAEAWGHDALTPLAFLAARTSRIKLGSGIVQIGARTPAMLAMTAMSLQALSNGRFLLGLGTSGPQVMEGWHGVSFAHRLQATRETIEIVRKVVAGERLDYAGRVYQIPLPGGAGKPLRTFAQPTKVPMYVAALGPKNLQLTGELANGWIGNAFIPERGQCFLAEIAAGAEKVGRSLADIDLVMPVGVEFTNDVEGAARRNADGYAFTIGAMGSKTQNFYNAAFTRQGYGDDIDAVQRLWLDGKRDAAAARVPLEIGMNTNLLGTAETVKDRLRAYQSAGITTLQAKLSGTAMARLDTLAQLVDLVGDVNNEAAVAMQA